MNAWEYLTANSGATIGSTAYEHMTMQFRSGEFMPDYNSIVNEVYLLTKRPDLVSATAIAIRKATMKYHGADDWPRDLVTVTITNPTRLNANDIKFGLDLTSLPFLRVRRITTVKSSKTAGVPLKLYDPVDINELMDDYNYELTNTWYRAGANLIVTSVEDIQALDVVYYQHPDVLAETYDSWIAAEHPDFIIEEAAGAIFKLVGKDEEAKQHRALFTENLQLLQMAYIG